MRALTACLCPLDVAVGCIRSLQYMLIGVSCWLQGHFQIAMNKERCPLLQKRLSWGMRILYMSGVWSYIVGLTSTPTFIIIPLVSLTPQHLPQTPLTLPPSALLPPPLFLPNESASYCARDALQLNCDAWLQCLHGSALLCFNIIHANIIVV